MPQTTYSIASDYAKIVDGRAFVVKAWEHPEKGGKFYASTVADSCAFIQHFTADLSTVQPAIENTGAENYLKSSEALKILQLRCGQFSEDELSAFSRQKVWKDPSNRDQLAKIAEEFPKSDADATQRKNAIALVLETGDPLLFDTLGSRLLLRADRNSFVFGDDSVPTSATEKNDLLPAVYLAPCYLGLPCDGNDVSLEISCASGAGCYESRHEKVMVTIARGNQARMNQIESLAQEMAAAFVSKDLGKFASID